ncbi:MAG: glycosyltransferase family 4 protein [Micavibrio aeruginosavorus]|uniref:Glycosyltransferase family 4 protein n=1 Tax=Micavibrio aeruginosavorus TaxID=349221 RepID=A0A7T5UIA1_9BACT|nr:MAG: glycosyltransferase family 4 protein [Micavibrio aeruginosavorus]
MQKPSVVFFNRVYPPARGASGRVLRDLARGFVRDGWSVTIITTGAEAAREKDGAIRIIRVKAPVKKKLLGAYLNVWLRMWWAGMGMPRADLVVTMTDPPLMVIAGDMMARAHKCRHIHWCQDLYPDVLPALGIKISERLMDFFRVRSRRAMKNADRVVVIGRCMARHLVRTGLEARKITLIPNWPDLELVAPDPRTRRPMSGRAAFRAANDGRTAHELVKPFEALFQDKDPRFRVLYSGTIGRAHPVQAIIEAAQILAKEHPEIEFVFVGDGPGFERLAQERARRSLDNVRLMPFQPAARLRELMESGDVHLISMREDSSGFIVPCKLYSALAVARPAILLGPQTSEVARVIDDFQAGTVVPQGDARKLAQAILRYRLDGDEWFAAHEGARRASRVFVPHEAINAWISRARDVCGIARPVRPVRRMAVHSTSMPVRPSSQKSAVEMRRSA